MNWEFVLTWCITDLQHHHERHGKYRLEDEELTHLGQSLGEIDKFEDVQLSDDDDNDDVDKEDAGKSYNDLLIVIIANLLMPHAPPGVSLSTEDDNDVDNGEQKSRGAEIEHKRHYLCNERYLKP